MSNEEVKVGDVVELKSGGPRMTVNSIGKDKSGHCKWFVTGDTVQADHFAMEALKRSSEPDPTSRY